MNHLPIGFLTGRRMKLNPSFNFAKRPHFLGKSDAQPFESGAKFRRQAIPLGRPVALERDQDRETFQNLGGNRQEADEFVWIGRIDGGQHAVRKRSLGGVFDEGPAIEPDEA